MEIAEKFRKHGNEQDRDSFSIRRAFSEYFDGEMYTVYRMPGADGEEDKPYDPRLDPRLYPQFMWVEYRMF